MLSKQEIVDKVYTHFITNKEPAGVSNGECVYEHPPCAVGILLTEGDKEILKQVSSMGTVEGMIGDIIDNIYNVHGMTIPALDHLMVQCDHGDTHSDFLDGLQHCHDAVATQWSDDENDRGRLIPEEPEVFRKKFSAKLKKFCSAHNLNYPGE